MLILAGALATIGVVCVVVAFGMGLKTSSLLQIVKDGHFSFDTKGFHIFVGEDFEGDSQDENFEVTEPFQDLDIEFGAGELEVYYADVANVEVKESGISNLRVDVRENTLVIREKTKGNININMDDLNDRSLVVLIPNGMKLREVDLEIGAATADITDLLADGISITVGAGKADVSNITSRQIEIEVGAGELNASQILTDELSVEAGLGQVNIDLNGVQEEYNYSVECGVGKVQVGEFSYSGLGTEKYIKNAGATKRIEIECGIGEVIVNFQK